MSDERKGDAVDKHCSGWRNGQQKRQTACGCKSGKLGNIRPGRDDSNATHGLATRKQRDAARIHRGGITIEVIGFAGNDSEPSGGVIDRTGGRNGFARRKSDVEATSAIGVLNPVKRRARSIRYSWRKMNAADEPYRARGEGSLVIGKESGSAGQSHCEFVSAHNRPKIPNSRGWRTRLVINGQNVTWAVDHRYDHRLRRRCGRSFNRSIHRAHTQGGNLGRGLGLRNRYDSTAAWARHQRDDYQSGVQQSYC